MGFISDKQVLRKLLRESTIMSAFGGKADIRQIPKKAIALNL